MGRTINLNADVGEDFGRYQMGHDHALLGVVRSVSIACGFHAGDPTIMHRLVGAAKAAGVSIGAHPGFDDRWGFGRREIKMETSDLEYLVAYQIGALQGLAAYSGIRVSHVKAHGALYNMAARDLDLAMAIGRAIRTVDRELIYVAQAGSEMERAASRLDLACAREAFPDRGYDDGGELLARGREGAIVDHPSAAAERALRMALDGEIVTASGRRIAARIDTLCIHGDTPNAVGVATGIRAALDAAGIAVVALNEHGSGAPAVSR